MWVGLDLKKPKPETQVQIKNPGTRRFESKRYRFIINVAVLTGKKERIFSTYKSPLRLDQSARDWRYHDASSFSSSPIFSLFLEFSLSFSRERKSENPSLLPSLFSLIFLKLSFFFSCLRLFFLSLCPYGHRESYVVAVLLLDYAEFCSALVSDHRSRRGGGRLLILFCFGIRSQGLVWFGLVLGSFFIWKFDDGTSSWQQVPAWS